MWVGWERDGIDHSAGGVEGRDDHSAGDHSAGGVERTIIVRAVWSGTIIVRAVWSGRGRS